MTDITLLVDVPSALPNPASRAAQISKPSPVGQRAIERYAQLLRVHVVPVLGERPLQQLQSSEIDALYTGLEARKVAARTAHHVHIVLGACLGAAVRTRKLTRNPVADVAKVPSPPEADHGNRT